MKTDALFYRLFKTHPKLALDFLGLDYQASSYRFSSEEIKQTAFRLDGIFTPLVDNPKQPLIFIEVQYQPDDDFYDRLFAEISLYLRLHKPQHEWLILVVYPSRKIERPANIAFLPFMNLPQLRIIYLEDYQDKEGESLALDLVRLLSCDKQETMKVACQLVNHYDVNTDVLNLIETILVYKIPRMSREEIRKMFELSEVDVTKSRYYQDAMQEALENTTVKKLQLKNPSLYQEMMDKGVNKGITQGVTQGMNQGLDKGMRLMLKQGLIHRFGELVPEIEQRLELANAEKINKWFFRSFDVESLEDIFDESND